MDKENPDQRVPTGKKVSTSITRLLALDCYDSTTSNRLLAFDKASYGVHLGSSGASHGVHLGSSGSVLSTSSSSSEFLIFCWFHSYSGQNCAYFIRRVQKVACERSYFARVFEKGAMTSIRARELHHPTVPLRLPLRGWTKRTLTQGY